MKVGKDEEKKKFWMVFGCQIPEFRFQPITDDRYFSDRLLVLV